jgi:DnaJ-class molecular chaperone
MSLELWIYVLYYPSSTGQSGLFLKKQDHFMEHKDYYSILGVDSDADRQEIKAAYRKLAFEYHPDRNKDGAAAAKMKEINESYAVLSDPDKRNRYDTLRRQFGSSAYGQFRQTYSEQDIFRGSDIHQIFEEISRVFGFRGFDDIFRESYGSVYRSFEFQKPGAFGRIFVSSFGKGEGHYPNFPLSGHLGKLVKYGLKKKWGIEWPEKGKDLNDMITISPALAQTGGKIRYFNRKKSKELLVNIPPGMRAGRQIRLKGMGEDGKGGAEPGDLYIEIRIKRNLLQIFRDFLKRMNFH